MDAPLRPLDFVVRDFLLYDVTDPSDLESLFERAGPPNTVFYPSMEIDLVSTGKRLRGLQALGRHWLMHLLHENVCTAWHGWPYSDLEKEAYKYKPEVETADEFEAAVPYNNPRVAWHHFSMTIRDELKNLGPSIEVGSIDHKDRFSSNHSPRLNVYTLETALIVQLVNLINDKREVKTCENCKGPWIFKHLPPKREAKRKGQPRIDGKYCSTSCERSVSNAGAYARKKTQNDKDKREKTV